jgi:tryptophan synthase alpha chain
MTRAVKRKVNRIDARLTALKTEGRKAFLTYLVAGYPDAEVSLAHMRCLARSGIDIIEVGYPFSDPILDGQTIQAINAKAVSAGESLARTLDLCGIFRADDKTTPLILMGYANPIAVMGYASFARRAAAAGVDGLIVGDMPLREAGPLLTELGAAGLYFIPLSAPTLPEREFAATQPGLGGFLYCIPVVGPTGGPAATDQETKDAVKRSRTATTLPVIVGFGIKSPAAAAAAARYGDGVVVASALLERLEAIRQNQRPAKVLDTLSREIGAYRRAIDQA